jgi:hypothetical protein
MGMITKRIHQKTTNRLVEPVRAVTRLDAEAVYRMLRHVVEQTPPKGGLLNKGEKLWLVGKPSGPWVVFYGPPARKEPDKVVRIWRADVTAQRSSDDSQTLVAIELIQWKTSDGTLVGRREFERFRDSFGTLLARSDPAYHRLDVT